MQPLRYNNLLIESSLEIASDSYRAAKLIILRVVKLIRRAARVR